MSFLDDDDAEGIKPEDKYLRIPDADQGKASKVKVRILDQKARGVWRHWIGPDRTTQRPYNCPSRVGGCLACHERDSLKALGVDYRDTHKMEKKYLVNVLILGAEPIVRIFSFGKRLSEKMNFLLEEYGDLRDYDITLIKRKTGPEKYNVEYDAIYSDDPDPKKRRKLDIPEMAAGDNRFDLDEEVKVADAGTIREAVAGSKGTAPATGGTPSNGVATPEMIARLTEVAAKQGFKLGDLQITNPEIESADKINQLIAKLS